MKMRQLVWYETVDSLIVSEHLYPTRPSSIGGIKFFKLMRMGVVSWPLVGGNYVLVLQFGAKILAAGRSWESTITQGLEYNYKYKKSIPFHSVWPL